MSDNRRSDDEFDAGGQDAANQSRRFELSGPRNPTMRGRLDPDALPAAAADEGELPPLPSFIPPTAPPRRPQSPAAAALPPNRRPPQPPLNNRPPSIPPTASIRDQRRALNQQFGADSINFNPKSKIRNRKSEGALPRLISWLAVIVAVLIVVSLAAIAIFEQSFGDRIYPGVHILDQDLSGLTLAQASEKVNASLDSFSSQPIVLRYNDKTWSPSLTVLGLKLDTEGTLQAAYQYGRSNNLLTDLGTQWGAYQRGAVVPIQMTLDEGTLSAYLHGIAKEIDQPLIEGDLQIEMSGTLKITPPQEAHTLDVFASIGRIKAGFNDLATHHVDLVVNVNQPVVGAAELQQVRQQAEAALSAPVVLQYADKSWTLDKPTIANWLTVSRVIDRQQPQHLILDLPQNKLTQFVNKVAGDLDQSPQNARFAWNGGGVSVISESKDGLTVQITDTVALLRSKIAAPAQPGEASRIVPIPVAITGPAVSSKDLPSLGIHELIGQGSSTFKGSTTARATNIKVAAGYLNGAVIPPGANFSFLNTIGDISLERGYVEGYVIVAERTKKDVGGGVCQVSTTTFRAAFWSGLPMMERNQHAYRVSWYEEDGSPVGFDAAVFDPGTDLKFTNDTGAYILVEAIADMNAQTLTVNFYGTKPNGRTVQMSGATSGHPVNPPAAIYEINPALPPGTKKQVEFAHVGLDATITRTITEGGSSRTDSFFSRYEPWPTVYQVSADVAPPGAKTVDPNGN